jgi:ElaB/YqjD/DUF883 family membrane-anchored ribosome-binding protein
MRDPTNPSSLSAPPETIDGAGPSGSAARGALAAELKHLVADVEELARQAGALGGDEFAAAKARIGARLTAAREGLAHAGESLAARARGTAEATDHYVHEQPWKAIAVGATLGLLLGFALARR